MAGSLKSFGESFFLMYLCKRNKANNNTYKTSKDMKKTMILSLLCTLFMGAQAADYNYLVFTLNDGSEQAIVASNLNITFTDGNLVATTANETLATIPLASLQKMQFSESNATGISALPLDSNDDIKAIYDLQGRMMPLDTQLPKGTYILKTSSRTIKVFVK